MVELARVQLSELQQKTGETSGSFRESLQDCAHRAYPFFVPEQQAELALHAFILAIKSVAATTYLYD